MVYTHWGKRTCPAGTELVYTGVMGGSQWSNKGGGANYLCMPLYGRYSNQLRYKHGFQGHGLIDNVGYSTTTTTGNQGRTAACTVCRVVGKTTTIMIPARPTCPFGWFRLYFGYIMSEVRDRIQSRYMYECIDRHMEVAEVPRRGEGVHIFYSEAHQRVGKGNYNSHKELNCVVCTK